jgi:hypothetical protein
MNIRTLTLFLGGIGCGMPSISFAQFHADYVESQKEAHINKMETPTAEVCSDFTRQNNARCDTAIPGIPAARNAQYLQYVLEAANNPHGVHPALILSSIAVETSFRGATLENLTEKDAWMQNERSMVTEAHRETLLCYPSSPLEDLESRTTLPTGTQLRLTSRHISHFDTDEDGQQDANEFYDRIAITSIPGVEDLRAYFPEKFVFQENEIFCTLNHVELRNRISPDFNIHTTLGYLWGRGIGQFGQNNAATYNLDWRAEKPIDELTAWNAHHNRDRLGDELWPIWSPRGSILAKSQFLHELWNRNYTDSVRGADHEPLEGDAADSYRVDSTYRFNEAHMVRYVIGMYNRGRMPINSLKEGYRQNLLLPREYIQSWHIPRLNVATEMEDGVEILRTVSSRDGFPILRLEYVNRCHVAKVNRVCGTTHQGYMGHFNNLFIFRDGQWHLRD